ncbi:MAG: OmpA/MotB family protein, partial [Campylobacterota bacterium]
LRRLALMFENMPPDLELNIRGHTDNIAPPATSMYRNNWEMSTARAMSVARVLIENGIDEQKMTIAGNGEYRPVATNATEEGRAKNRRVELEFYAKKEQSGSAARQSVLEMDE